MADQGGADPPHGDEEAMDFEPGDESFDEEALLQQALLASLQEASPAAAGIAGVQMRAADRCPAAPAFRPTADRLLSASSRPAGSARSSGARAATR